MGTANLGFAFWNNELKLVNFLTFCPKSKNQDYRLQEVYDFCRQFPADFFVYEKPVFNKGFRFAAALSEMVGIIKLSYRKSQIFAYTATHVKKALTGNGRADKEEVLRFVEKIYADDFRGATNHAVDAVAIGHACIIKEKIK